MGVMNDIFKRGYVFDGATGEKTGANLEDLVTRAGLVSGSQMLDQTYLTDEASGTIVDDTGAAIRRATIKAGSIDSTRLSAALLTTIDEATWGGPELLNGTIFANAAAAAAAMATLGSWTVAPTDVVNIFDKSVATAWGESYKAIASPNSVAVYWDLGAVYKGNLFIASDVRGAGINVVGGFSTYDWIPNNLNEMGYNVGQGLGYSYNAAARLITFSMPFYGRYVGMYFFNADGINVSIFNVRRFEVYGKAV